MMSLVVWLHGKQEVQQFALNTYMHIGSVLPRVLFLNWRSKPQIARGYLARHSQNFMRITTIASWPSEVTLSCNNSTLVSCTPAFCSSPLPYIERLDTYYIDGAFYLLELLLSYYSFSPCCSCDFLKVRADLSEHPFLSMPKFCSDPWVYT